MLHCSQCNSHSFVDCFEHFGVDPLHSNCTTLCSLDKSKRSHPHKLCTDVRVKCHSTNGCQGSHIDDTFKHLVGCTRGRWSYKNLIKYCHPSKENPPKNTHLFIQNVLFNRLIKIFLIHVNILYKIVHLYFLTICSLWIDKKKMLIVTYWLESNTLLNQPTIWHIFKILNDIVKIF